jgi:hypothetical protein
MSSEGMVLKQVERVVVRLLEGANSAFRLERSRILDC